ncbi:MAG: dihydrodipicolinate synthase family protein, partial [Planctomycetota bacterium]
DWSLDVSLFRLQIRLLRDHLTRHLYLFGTAGEGYAVSDRQFDQIVRVFRDEMSGPDNHPAIGVISLSLSTIIERIARCGQMGFRTFFISLPSWGALSDKEVDTFFREVCGRFGDYQFLHYNLSRTKRVLLGRDYARLSKAHRNLVAVKYGGGSDTDVRRDMLKQAPSLQFFFGERGYMDLREESECGLLISLASCNFTMAKALFNARGDELRQLGAETNQIYQALRAAVGEAGHIDGVFDKMLIKAHIPLFPLRLLPPYCYAEDSRLLVFLDRLPSRWRPAEGLMP